MKTGEKSEIPTKSFKKGYILNLCGTVSVDIQVPGYIDTTSPSVDITDVDLRPDGFVKIQVDAGDVSGIEKVKLYRDNKYIDETSVEPFVFIDRPEGGWHTYKAKAVDNSPNKNERESFKRTIEVVFARPGR